MNQFGLLQVYTGDGKGKTTASLGLAFRACGHGFQVCMIQFMKDTGIYGEEKMAAQIPGLTIIPSGRNDFVDFKNPAAIDIRKAQAGWAVAKGAIESQAFNIVIMDEINVALHCGLLDKQEVLEFLRTQRGSTEVVATGRWAPQELIDMADLVTEMKEIRHPFSQGMQSREGIDH